MDFPEARSLVGQTPAVAGQDLVRLNRWLLDDTYAAQLATSHEILMQQERLVVSFPIQPR